MGLFSRKDSAPSRKPTGKPRPSVTSEAQAADLRIRARRRLAGAVALVLAAVVILPMLLDAEPTPVANNIPIRIPDRQTPFEPNLSQPDQASPISGNEAGQVAAPGTPPSPSTQSDTTPVPQSSVAQTKPESLPKAEQTAEPPKVAAKPAPEPAPAAKTRRDDAARALALLEGRSPVATAPSAKPPVRGNYFVQAMSLDSAADAQKQRNVLTSAGINNALVEGPIDVNGRPKYRVKVGPFQSREAAQAAQTRLRTQGYGGAFITTQ